MAGGVALNREAARYSHDIDVFNDTVAQVVTASSLDADALRGAGFHIEWTRQFDNIRSARVSLNDEATEIDWAHDSAWRFFPAEPDPVLGYALHSFDLATNKALAAANRSVPRDAVDLVTVHETMFPLGAVVIGAVGKDEGFSPELLLNFIARFARWRDKDFENLEFTTPVSAADISRRLKFALADAQDYVARVPSEACGFVYLDGDRIVQPDPDRLSDYERRPASVGGVWPVVPGMLAH